MRQAPEKGMIIPEFLTKKDTIAIVATARKITNEEIEAAVQFLQQWRYVVKIGATVGKEAAQLAGTDSERAADFQAALDDPTIQAIWCARGGYGTVRMIDAIDFSRFKQQPKWIIGYSDITVLHSHIHQMGIATMHAPMPIDIFQITPAAITSFQNTLVGAYMPIAIAPHPCNKTGTASGVLVGGNLSILYSLCGSDSALDTRGKILFIEDIDEYLYHIDRMLQNLKRNGYFEGLQGLIVGGMTKMHDNTTPFGGSVEEIILAAVAEYDFPVAFNFPAGHVVDNHTVVLGKAVHLSVAADQVVFKYDV